MSQYKDTRRANTMLKDQLEADESCKLQEAEHCKAVCEEIASLITAEEYNEWYLSTPNSNAEFLKAAEAKLRELKSSSKIVGKGNRSAGA